MYRQLDVKHLKALVCDRGDGHTHSSVIMYLCFFYTCLCLFVGCGPYTKTRIQVSTRQLAGCRIRKKGPLICRRHHMHDFGGHSFYFFNSTEAARRGLLLLSKSH